MLIRALLCRINQDTEQGINHNTIKESDTTKRNKNINNQMDNLISPQRILEKKGINNIQHRKGKEA